MAAYSSGKRAAVKRTQTSALRRAFGETLTNSASLCVAPHNAESERALQRIEKQKRKRGYL
jgi:hypothetical protein